MLEYVSSLALAIGAAVFIGLEREKSAYKEKVVSLFSIRAYVFLGLGGWMAAFFGMQYGNSYMIGILAVLSLTVILSYYLGWQYNLQPSLTSTMSALATIAIGTLSVAQPLIAIIIAVIAALSLTLKTNLQKFALGLAQTEYIAAIKFVTISAIVTPLLPNNAIDPWGMFNPQKIWLMVVLISGIGFIGYILTKLYGRKRSTMIMGILGGLVSSTAVTVTMAQLSRKTESKTIANIFVATTLAANGMMYLRVLIWIGVLFPCLLGYVSIPLIGMAIAVSVFVFFAYNKPDSKKHSIHADTIPLESPLKLLPALKFAGVFMIIIVLTHVAKTLFGESGLYATAVISGLADVDAITLQLSTLVKNGEIMKYVGAIGIVTAVITNTVVKGILGNMSGNREYGRTLAFKVGVVAMIGIVLSTISVLFTYPLLPA